jgi:hypothetical protein
MATIIGAKGVLMMEFSTCPRCGDEWNLSLCGRWKDSGEICTYRCVKCNLDYGHLAPAVPHGVYLLLSNDKVILWMLNNHSCWYLPYDNERYRLPWLPFDITEERLKLLLVFS